VSEPYRDVWPVHIPDNKLDAYRELIDEGQIRDVHVTYHCATGITTVKYRADMTQDEIRQELRRRSG
jgi:hypothetical protein